MSKVFHLSWVYDINGYNRKDLFTDTSLQKIDSITSKYKNADDLLIDNEIDKPARGKLCIVYEDVSLKQEQIKSNTKFSYAHIIPIMYANKRLLNFNECYKRLGIMLYQQSVRKAIIDNPTEEVDANKKFVFAADYLFDNDNYLQAISRFLQRIVRANDDEKYLACRALMNICSLFIKIDNPEDELSPSIKNIIWKYPVDDNIKEKIEEIHDMDELYRQYDLDKIINHSDGNPIGIESEERTK